MKLYLFMDSVIGTAETMRESEVDFGIDPLPKKDEAQEAYRSDHTDLLECRILLAALYLKPTPPEPHHSPISSSR